MLEIDVFLHWDGVAIRVKRAVVFFDRLTVIEKLKVKVSGEDFTEFLEAFGLSLNFAGTRDALAESPTNSSSAALAPVAEDGSHLVSIREAMGNVMAALLRELKLWLYREGMLETGLPVPPGGTHGALLHRIFNPYFIEKAVGKIVVKG